MANASQFRVLDLATLEWQASLDLSSKQFRLFVAADTFDMSVDQISGFVLAALKAGMIYCSAWGRGCERFHDIADECISEHELGSGKHNVVMTTWHENEMLQEALDFFATSAVPTLRFMEDNEFHIVICVGHSEWTGVAKRFLSAT